MKRGPLHENWPWGGGAIGKISFKFTEIWRPVDVFLNAYLQKDAVIEPLSLFQPPLAREAYLRYTRCVKKKSPKKAPTESAAKITTPAAVVAAKENLTEADKLAA